MTKLYTGPEFVDALASETYDEGVDSDIVIQEGLMKADAVDTDFLFFSKGTNCDEWNRLPVTMIDQVELIRIVPCGDHRHPFVRLQLKAPAGNQEATIFAKMLRSGDPAPSFHGTERRTATRRTAASHAEATSFIQSNQRDTTNRKTGYARSATLQAEGPLRSQQPTAIREPRVAASAHSGTESGVEEAWRLVERFSFDIIDGCFYLFFVDVHRRWRSGNWDYKVAIHHGGVLQGGSCNCFPGMYRRGYVSARINGTGGGYLFTGDKNVYSSGGEVHHVFESIYPGVPQSCDVEWENWCTF